MNALPKAVLKPSRIVHSRRNRPLEQRHFLLVEELPDRRRLSAQMLEDAGAEVMLERHALTGVIVALSMPERFDALILDVRRPLLEIVEASVALRSAGFDRPIIALVPVTAVKAKGTLESAGCHIIQTGGRINSTFVKMVTRYIDATPAALN
jgi:CheY-like chemotaxis protein